ncbi:MAG: HemK family protein methyltransferase [Candidatus Gracilibacteria bacterium]
MKKQELIKLGKEKYNLDSRTINQVLEFVFDLSKEKVFLLEEINPVFYEKIIFIFEKLSSGYPLAYIKQKVNFMGLNFYVNEDVLIPRDDTEVLINEVIKDSERNLDGKILLDIGTGAGIIPITLAKKLDFKEIIAFDISDKALVITKKNIIKYNLDNIISLINVDFRKFDYKKLTGENLIITANLPYIKEGDFENMDFGVYNFEPKIALYGGKNTGFELYEELINLLIKEKTVFNSLVLFIEIGFDQYEVSKNFLSKKGLKFEFFKDTNNIDRVIKIII